MQQDIDPAVAREIVQKTRDRIAGYVSDNEGSIRFMNAWVMGDADALRIEDLARHDCSSVMCIGGSIAFECLKLGIAEDLDYIDDVAETILNVASPDDDTELSGILFTYRWPLWAWNQRLLQENALKMLDNVLAGRPWRTE